MLQIVGRLLRALDKSADTKPKTLLAWPIFAVAVAVRWLIGRVLWGWRRLTVRPRRFPINRPYVNPRHPARMIAKFTFPLALAVICVIYGFMFGLTAPFLLIPFAVPIVVLVLLAIWALPDTHNAPTKSMEAFFAAVIVSLLVWPNYLALSLPGLPWITALRLTSYPMVFLFLICLSSSSSFRSETGDALKAAPGLWFLFVSLIVIQLLTAPLGKSMSESFTAVMNFQLNCTIMFVLGVWLARTPGKTMTYATLFVLLTLPMAFVGILESLLYHPLWVNHVPSFLKIDDALAAKYMGAVTRGDVYRVKSIYSGPLSFAEVLALITPLCLHFAVTKRKVMFRVMCALLIPTFFICIRMTDARLGILGMLVSFLAYFLLWALLQLGRNARSLMAAAVVYAYPAAFGFAIMAVLFVHRVRVLVLGGGEQASSDDARQAQVNLGIPKILSHPQGYGAGNAAETLGYAPFGMITIDNYYLSIALDYGILGFIAFYGLFIAAITAAIRTILKSPSAFDTDEKTLVLPLAVSTTVFIVIRGVLSQEDNHILAFSVLGLLVGLLYQVQQTAKAQKAALDAAARDAEPVVAKNTRLIPRPRPTNPRPSIAETQR